MDEFDKIREISEDLTNRREPTFTQLGKGDGLKPTPSVTPTPVPTGQSSMNVHPHAVDENAQRMQTIHSFLQQPVQQTHNTESVFRLTNNLNDRIDTVQIEPVQERVYSPWRTRLIGGCVFVGVVCVVCAGFFFLGGNPSGVDEVVTITTAPTLIKESPEQAGGMNIPNQDKLVYNSIRSGNVTTKVESLFAEPEKPVVPQILMIEENEAEEKFVNIDTVKAVNPLNEPAKPVVVATKVQKKQEQSLVVDAVKGESKKDTLSENKASVLPLEKKKSTQEIVQNKPTIKEAKKSGNIWRVQLFSSNNQSAVEKAWSRILKKHNALLSDMTYDIEPAQIKGKGTFYRLKVGQFSTREMATALCAKLKAQKQDCVPAK